MGAAVEIRVSATAARRVGDRNPDLSEKGWFLREYAVPVQVAEVMSRVNVTDSPSDPLVEAASRMWRQQTGSLLVMDGDELLGIVTERDVMKAVARGMDLATTPVSAIMTATVQTVEPSTPVTEAARHMAERWIRHLPVVDDGKVIGMVSQRDLCGVLARLPADQLTAAATTGADTGGLVRDRRLARVDTES
jgi:CBS domain-containing protein